MVGCDVTKNRRYGVESYDYTIRYRLQDDYIAKKPFTQTNDARSGVNSYPNKRRHTDRSNAKLRLGKRVNSNQRVEEKQEPRILPDLSVSAESPLEDIAKEIAENLAEDKKDLVGSYIFLIIKKYIIKMFNCNNKL